MDKSTLQLVTRLDTSKVNDDLKKLENQVNKKGLCTKTALDTTASEKGIKKLADSANGVKNVMTLLDTAIKNALGGKSLGKPVSVYG